ncbi:gliding motility-associated C-terminal domain-containing protein [Filimonas lacunae]|uniref:Gliding motility-associated C-terminal domain-containing protein n=1 Tax=Filimonas lacunae TaxID=477680 RepID=A0A173ML21_9BACT|nr:gliding motility-associated C-terminal domain-containing protein [Filimonas lacunae]BAV08091.1 internalin [Filimonas lacunae]SIT09185.1 gliding motility-associated C-terminal domain-containing protein [Filimonas lacunae]
MLNTPVSNPVRGIALLCACLTLTVTCIFGQWPGGVSGSLTTWFKANTTGNIIIPNTTTNGVSQWNSEKGTFSITQATASRQPVFTATNTTNGSFNFNPFVQFSKTSNTVLYNTSNTDNLLGNNGSIFMVINTYRTIADGNPSSFTYKNSVTNSSIAYQFKPGFRIQTGDGISGSTADYYNWGAPLPSPAPTYPETSGILLTAKGVDKATTDKFFNGRRNGDSIAITHRYDAPYDGYSYTPSISYGFFLGSDATTTGAQNMSCGIAELITFNTLLSDADQNKVESYLAIKYGITLTKKHSFYNLNYVAATGTVLWDTTANTGYWYNITGIGRDDASGLQQKQSRSMHNNALISLYNGFGYTSLPTANATNSNTIATDNSFLLTADNGLSTQITRCSPDNQLVHMARIWKVQKTGSGIDSVTIAVNATDVPANATRLLVSADNTFPAAATVSYPLKSISGQLATAVHLTDKVYFTFGTDTLHVAVTTVQPDCDHPNAGSVSAGVTGGVTPYTYLWTPSAATTASITNLSGDTYTLAVTHAGCTYTTSATIQAVEAATTPQVDDQSVCPNQTATFTVKNPATGATYAWYTSNTGGTPLSNTAPGTSYSTGALSASATYYVEAISATGCKSTPRTAVSATVLTVLAQPVVTVTTTTLNSITFSWAPVTGATGYQVSVNNSTYQTPNDPSGLSHTVTDLTPMTEASIRVIALGVQTCQNSAAGAATGKTLSAEVYIPNVFTPNADGKNDVFKVYSNIIRSMQLKVFNQWGELIFSSSDSNAAWDGTYKGKPQPVGIYVYAIKITLTNGNQVIRKGDINLLR